MTGGPPPPGPWARPPYGPPGAPRPGPPTRGRPESWFLRGGWWFFVHLITFGALTVIPLADAAVRIRRAWPWVILAVSVVVGVGSFALIGTAPKDVNGDVLDGVQSLTGLTGLLVLFVGTFGVLFVLRTHAYPADGARSGGSQDPAIGAALRARKRRSEARALAAKDPMLARELRIGRPDLPRTYDDGGLVDVNEAGREVIARVCGIDLAHGTAIVEAREVAGRFGAVEDVFARVELPVHIWDVIRDRGIVVG